MAYVSLDLARELKQAGLEWRPALHDRFAIPDRGLDDRVFVIGDLLSTLQSVQGRQVVSFHGSLEWALDSLVTSEVVWVPSEGQLREMVEVWLRMDNPNGSALTLRKVEGSSYCDFAYQGREYSFEGAGAPEAYARALLFFLRLSSES